MALRVSALSITLLLLGTFHAQAHFLSSEQGRIEATTFGAKVIKERPGDSVKPKKDEEQEPAGTGDNIIDNPRRSMDYKNQVEKKSTPKYPVIAFFHLRLKSVFGKLTEHWYMDWKLWVGLLFWGAVWAKWIKYGYDEIYWVRATQAFGINIWILHQLQYGSTIRMGMLNVVIALAAQNLFQSWWSYSKVVEQAEQDPSEETSPFKCDTLYLDLKLPREQVLVLFVAQVGVWWFYMTSILGNYDLDNVNYLFWIWAYMVMQMTMILNRGEDSVLGNAFPVHDVVRLMRHAGSVNFQPADVEEKEEDMDAVQIGRNDILWRAVTGFFCNSILREIMTYTIPLMLMGFSEPMDFVVYCVGVNFICTLDDMSEMNYIFKSKDSAEVEVEEPEEKTS